MAYFITDTDKTNALLDNLEHREREVAQYQASQDSLTLQIAAAEASDDDFLKGHAEHLRELLADTQREQAKAQLAHDSILDQLHGEDIPALIAARPKREPS